MELDWDGQLALSLTGSAQLNPEKLDEALPYFFSGLKSTVEQPNTDDLQKIKEILLKQAKVSAKTNGYWTGILRNYVVNGIDLHTDYQKMVSDVNGKAISDFLKNIVLKPGNHLEVIMKATKEEAGK